MIVNRAVSALALAYGRLESCTSKSNWSGERNPRLPPTLSHTSSLSETTIYHRPHGRPAHINISPSLPCSSAYPAPVQAIAPTHLRDSHTGPPFSTCEWQIVSQYHSCQCHSHSCTSPAHVYSPSSTPSSDSFSYHSPHFSMSPLMRSSLVSSPSIMHSKTLRLLPSATRTSRRVVASGHIGRRRISSAPWTGRTGPLSRSRRTGGTSSRSTHTQME